MTRPAPRATGHAPRAKGMTPSSARVQHGRVMFRHNGADTFGGFLARPKAGGLYPAVVVIAGNKISEEYIPNTCAVK